MRYLIFKTFLFFVSQVLIAQGGYENKINAGKVKIQSGDFYGAMDIFNQAIGISPERPEAYVGLAKTRNKMNNYDLALKDINQALEINPEYPDAWVESGEIHTKMKEYEKAINDYDKALDIEPQYPKAIKNKILVLLLLDNEKEASKLLDDGLKNNPDYWGFYYARGVILNSKGKFSKALDDFGRALELNPDDKFEIAINRGFSNLGLQNLSEALNDFNTALNIDPNNAGAYHSRARTHYLLEDYNAAIEDYNQSLYRNENNPVVYYDLGMAYLKNDEINNACKNFQKSCQLGNTNACKKFLFECTNELDDIK